MAGEALGGFTAEIDPVTEGTLDLGLEVAGSPLPPTTDAPPTSSVINETSALRFLLEATTLLSSSLDFAECLQQLAELAVPVLGDLCMIDLLSDGAIVRMAAAHYDPSRRALMDEVLQYPPNPNGSHPAVRALRTGRAEISPTMTDAFLRQTTRDDRHFQLVKELGFTSYMCAPLRARGRTLGSLTIVSAGSGRRFAERDLALAEDLAYRAALVIDNARLFSEKAEVARSLQSALLPPRLPTIPGLEVAARYRASGEHNEVGGDFYDLFALGRGAWGAVIGDVCGRGAAAAAVTGLVRHALHASAVQARNPAVMLQVANTVLSEHQDAEPERFCSAACAVIRPAEVTRVTFASAGHPAPLVVRGNGAIEEVRGAGMALGIAGTEGPHCQTRRTALLRGDTLVMFTDGVTEARDAKGRFFEDTGLREVLSTCAGLSAEATAARLLDSVEIFTGGRLNDDLAILVVRASTPSA